MDIWEIVITSRHNTMYCERVRNSFREQVLWNNRRLREMIREHSMKLLGNVTTDPNERKIVGIFFSTIGMSKVEESHGCTCEIECGQIATKVQSEACKGQCRRLSVANLSGCHAWGARHAYWHSWGSANRGYLDEGSSCSVGVASAPDSNWPVDTNT